MAIILKTGTVAFQNVALIAQSGLKEAREGINRVRNSLGSWGHNSIEITGLAQELERVTAKVDFFSLIDRHFDGLENGREPGSELNINAQVKHVVDHALANAVDAGYGHHYTVAVENASYKLINSVINNCQEGK